MVGGGVIDPYGLFSTNLVEPEKHPCLNWKASLTIFLRLRYSPAPRTSVTNSSMRSTRSGRAAVTVGDSDSPCPKSSPVMVTENAREFAPYSCALMSTIASGESACEKRVALPALSFWVWIFLTRTSPAVPFPASSRDAASTKMTHWKRLQVSATSGVS